ncbi:MULTISPECIES: bifunctional tetrahydrofolate synthase/dihydrofolate synthase [unclassified Moraxella]|uniref:bifunctional tetrahydrofolate synthase/dihydrofolate synthase n=1 Tax=unclassified Moraxella TaxID=2685852 RepID=UPI003AF55D46
MQKISTVDSTLTDWLNYMQGIHVSAIDMGLERVIPVFEKLGIGKTDAYVFTVAGTNGKGSTTATIAQICQTAGYKTALYQSPHLLVFNERVKINGEMVDDQTLINAFAQVEQARLDCGLTLSFFEMTTLSAFLIFSQSDCDVWVLEIGLGGRLDVVNVIEPNLAVITNVGIDHVDWLGDTREKIGVEKAGILRDGITLVYGESDMPNTIPPLIAQHQAKLIHYAKDFAYQEFAYQENLDNWQYSNSAVTLSLPKPNLSIHNTATAITALLASGLNITQSHIAQAMPNIRLAGRFDTRYLAERQWVFDVAHNEHGIDFLLGQFLPFWKNYQDTHPTAKLHLVFSMLADKDIEKVLSKLQTLPIDTVHSGVIDHFRATAKAQLATALNPHFQTVYLVDTLAQATQSALEHSQIDDMILVCGSFHTIGEVLHTLENQPYFAQK